MKDILPVAWLVFLTILLVVTIVPLIIMLCWNGLMPDLFNLPYITFWQALLMSILSSALFKQTNFNAQNK
jgi:hypothetical protein